MLVLTRRIGEGIVMNDEIEVTVLAVNGGKVRLGITAPPSVSIQRDELLTRNGEAGPALRQRASRVPALTR